MQYAYADPRVTSIRPGTLTSQYTSSFIASVQTDLYCEVHSNRYYLDRPLVSCGFVLQHALPSATQASFEKEQAAAIDRLYETFRLTQLKLAGFAGQTNTTRPEPAFPAQRPATAQIVKMAPALRNGWTATLNTLLRTLPTKPPTNTWNLKLPPAFKVVSERGGSYVVEVPVEGELKLPTSFEALEIPTVTRPPIGVK